MQPFAEAAGLGRYGGQEGNRMTLAEGTTGAGVRLSVSGMAADTGVRLALASIAVLLVLRLVLSRNRQSCRGRSLLLALVDASCRRLLRSPADDRLLDQGWHGCLRSDGLRRAFCRALEHAGRLLFSVSGELEPVPRCERGVAGRAMAERNPAMQCRGTNRDARHAARFLRHADAVRAGQAHRDGPGRVVVRRGRGAGARLRKQIYRGAAAARRLRLDDCDGGGAALVHTAGAVPRGAASGGAGRARVLVELRARLGLVCQAGSARRQRQACKRDSEHRRAAGRAGWTGDAAYLRLLCFRKLFALLRGWKRRDARWLLLGGATAPVFLFFLVHAASQKIQPNWPGFIYPAAILAAVHGFLAVSKERAVPAWIAASFRLAPWMGIVFTLAAFIQLGLGALPIEAKKDPTARLKGWAQFGSEIAALADAQGAVSILTQNYAVTGELAFYGANGRPVLQISERIRYANLPAPDEAGLKSGACAAGAAPWRRCVWRRSVFRWLALRNHSYARGWISFPRCL